MANHLPVKKFGIVDQTNAGWTAGSSYTKMLVYSLYNVCKQTESELCLFTNSEAPSGLPAGIQIIHVESSRRLPGEERLRYWLHLSDISSVFNLARKNHVSVVLPLLDVPIWKTSVKRIAWIPDFQHVYLPQFFSETELRQRDSTVKRVVQQAEVIMLSSETSLNNLKELFPQFAYKGQAISFPSLLAFQPPLGDAIFSVYKYHIPPKFALVANQFWSHKNHLVVVEALRELKQAGLRIPVVMTGLPSDSRDPTNQTMSRLLQAIACSGLNDQISILGQVPYTDLINLMRSAALVIQPSRFEGWSTVVQDAKALGRPLICSDIPLHREQAPNALGFFACDSVNELSGLLMDIWQTVEPGPDSSGEERALAVEQNFARQHGEQLLSLCYDISADS